MTQQGTTRPVDALAGSLEAIVRRELELLGVVLDRFEYAPGGRTAAVRVFIDEPGGVSVDRCAEVSRHLAAVLEQDDPIPGAYVLEVSSPGLTRPLRQLDDYRRFAGRLAVVIGREPIDGRRSEVTGVLGGVVGDRVIVEERDTGRRLEVPVDVIARARLEIEAGEPPHGR